MKSEAHRNGYWHRGVHVWIVNSRGELLIQKRSPEKEAWPNLWDISAAGHVSAGDDSLDSAMRETEEELGLRLGKNEFKYLFTMKDQAVLNDGTFINNEYDDVYLIQADINISKLTLQKEEVSEAKYIHFTELEKAYNSGNAGFIPNVEEGAKLFQELRKRFF